MEPFILAFAISWVLIFVYLLSLLKNYAEFNKRLM
ncbi:CcmD family protein [Methanosarcina sp. DH2]|nr:CcmD family protein [Methanosarcina sp. DH2]